MQRLLDRLVPVPTPAIAVCTCPAYANGAEAKQFVRCGKIFSLKVRVVHVRPKFQLAEGSMLEAIDILARVGLSEEFDWPEELREG